MNACAGARAKEIEQAIDEGFDVFDKPSYCFRPVSAVAVGGGAFYIIMGRESPFG